MYAVHIHCGGKSTNVNPPVPLYYRECVANLKDIHGLCNDIFVSHVLYAFKIHVLKKMCWPESMDTCDSNLETFESFSVGRGMGQPT